MNGSDAARPERPDPMQPAELGPLMSELLPLLDARLHAAVVQRYQERRAQLPRQDLTRCVLVGHRAAGKSRVLPVLARALGKTPIDLDGAVQARFGRSLRDWVREDPQGFRAAERTTFSELPEDALIAAGGGFLSLHADLLEGRCAVLVPVSFRTFRERLLADATRPRLRPELPLEEELRVVYRAREFAHRQAVTVPLADVAAQLDGPGSGGARR